MRPTVTQREVPWLVSKRDVELAMWLTQAEEEHRRIGNLMRSLKHRAESQYGVGCAALKEREASLLEKNASR